MKFLTLYAATQKFNKINLLRNDIFCNIPSDNGSDFAVGGHQRADLSKIKLNRDNVVKHKSQHW